MGSEMCIRDRLEEEDRVPSDQEDDRYEMQFRQSRLAVMGMRDESTVMRAWKRHPSRS